MQKEFLESILPSGTVTIWRRGTYGPKAPIDIQKWFTNPEDIQEILSYVETNSTWDVYTSPASYTEQKRVLEAAHKVQTVWLDADSCELTNLRVEPTWKIQSSPGRWQAWWVLDQEYEVTRVANLVKKISYAHREQGADISSWAANKLMRVPGSVNSNYGFPVQVTAENTGLIYTLEEIEEQYKDVTVDKKRTKAPSSDSKVQTEQDLPEYMKVLNKLPSNLIETVTKQIPSNVNRSEFLFRVLCDLVRFEKLSYDEILTVMWHAPAASKWSREDNRGIAGLANDLDKAYYDVDYQKQKLENTPRPQESKAFVENVKLINEEERAIATDQYNFVEQYVEWSQTKTSSQNKPYDYMNAFAVLSLIYSDKFFIPLEEGDRFLNLYMIQLGQTTTGKSAAKSKFFKATNTIFKHDPNYNLGGNMSPEALASKLLERDEKSSLIIRDEVHGWFKTLVDPRGGYVTGLVEDYAQLYDGIQPPILRKSMKGDSGKSARVAITMLLMGTPEEVLKVLTRDLFKSGFLARFIWAIGNPRNVTKKSLQTKLRTGERANVDIDEIVEEWAQNSRIMTQGAAPRSIDLTDVIERIDQAKWDLVRLVPENDANYDILNPSLVRLCDTIMKCVSLLAVSDGRTKAELRDVYYILWMAETWASNLIKVAAQISASEFENECDEIEVFVESKPEKSVSGPTLFNRFKSRNPRDLRIQLESLESRGILLRKESGGKVVYFINANKDT